MHGIQSMEVENRGAQPVPADLRLFNGESSRLLGDGQSIPSAAPTPRPAYRCLGRGAPTLLLSPPGVSSTIWDPIVEELASQFLLFLPNIPDAVWQGFEKDGNPLASHWLKLFLDQLNLDRVHIVGVGAAGVMGMRLAWSHPSRVQRLVLVNHSGLAPKKADNPNAPTEPVDLSMTVFGGESWGAEYLRAAPQDDSAPSFYLNPIHLRRIPHATLLLWGTDSDSEAMDQARLAIEMLPNARLHTVADSGPHLFVEQPETFNELVSSFLTGRYD